MIRFLVIICFVLCLNISGFAQTATDFKIIACETPEDVINIVDTVLLKGLSEKGLVSNITFKGFPVQFGRFEQGDSIGFKHGIILTTGFSYGFEGPNESTGTYGWPTFPPDTPGDSDLFILSGNGEPSWDAAVIEFDFIPQKEILEFNFIFGSDEYNEYVDKDPYDLPYENNDVFGFFLSGPEILGEFSNQAKNIAIIPFINDPLGIESVNCGEQNIFKYPPPMDGPNCQYLIWNDKFEEHPYGKSYIEFDAYTVPLPATYQVIPRESYHIKLAISDIYRSNWDSGVFLEAGSFDIGLLYSQISDEKDFTDHLIKDCNRLTYRIYLQNQATEDLEIPLTYIGNMQQGIDVNTLPASVIIPAGLTETSFQIECISDDISLEEKWLGIQRPISPYSTDQFHIDTIYLQDYDPMEIANFPASMDVDCDEEVLFAPEITKGIAPYRFTWDWQGDISQDEIYTLNTNVPGSLNLSVQDLCERELLASCDISVNGAYLELPPDMEVCYGTTIELHAETPAEDILWSTGETTADIQVTITSDETFWCQITACGEMIQKEIQIKVILPYAELGPDTLICPGKSVVLEASEGESYLWNTGETTKDITVSPQESRLYYIDITNQCADIARDSIWVNIDQESFAYAGADTAVCNGSTLYFYGEGGESVEWIYQGSVLSTQRQIEVKPSADMQIILKTYAYCNAQDTLNISWHPSPQFSLDVLPEQACSPLAICWKPESSVEYQWEWSSEGEVISNQQNLEQEFTLPGLYDIQLKASTDHCADSLLFEEIIEVYERPHAQILSPELEEYLCGAEEYSFSAENPNPLWTYLWELSEGNEYSGAELAYTFQEVGDAWMILAIQSDHHCTDSDTLYFKTIGVGPDLIVPTAFSPNGDGKNDVFEVVSHQLQEFHLQIYNRWGGRIYESTDPHFQWKGNANTPSETYVVKIAYTTKEGKAKVYLGMVVVI